MKFSAFIPIKLHSERIPNKNFYNLNGKPLFYYIFNTLMRINHIDEIVVNTDSNEVESRIKKYFKNINFILREESLSSPLESVNKLIASNINHIKNDCIIQTHVTNPLLSYDSINMSLEQYIKNKKPIFSVNALQTRLYDSKLDPMNHDLSVLLPTQSLEPVYEENSNFYIFSKKQFIENDYNRIGKSSEIFKTSKSESIDIDNFDDLHLVEKLISS